MCILNIVYSVECIIAKKTSMLRFLQRCNIKRRNMNLNVWQFKKPYSFAYVRGTIAKFSHPFSVMRTSSSIRTPPKFSNLFSSSFTKYLLFNGHSNASSNNCNFFQEKKLFKNEIPTFHERIQWKNNLHV